MEDRGPDVKVETDIRDESRADLRLAAKNSDKKPVGIINRLRTWYLNRGTLPLDEEEMEGSLPASERHASFWYHQAEKETSKKKARFFKRVGKPEQSSPLKLAITRGKRRVRDFFQDHPNTQFCMEQVWLIFLELVSAFIFAYGYRCFIGPSRVPYEDVPSDILGSNGMKMTEAQYNSLPLYKAASLISPTHLVSGGASGIGQVFTRIVLLFGVTTVSQQTLQSLFYFLVNLPIIILGFIKVGKKFTFYSLVNVLFTSILIDRIPQSWCEIINIYDDPLARALAGGLTTGVSSGMALAIGTSTGGVDILSIFIAEKKGTTVGKYSLVINTCTVLIYTALNFIHAPADSVLAFENGSSQLTMSLYTIIYFCCQTLIVDNLNTKNKKTELQIFTTSKIMNRVLIHGFPHACTVQDARGGFSGTPLSVIYVVVSHSEVKKAIKIMRTVDPNCFISVIATKQVYGKFYIKPLE